MLNLGDFSDEVEDIEIMRVDNMGEESRFGSDDSDDDDFDLSNWPVNNNVAKSKTDIANSTVTSEQKSQLDMSYNPMNRSVSIKSVARPSIR